MVGLIHEELSQTIIGAAMQVPWKRIVQSMPEWRRLKLSAVEADRPPGCERHRFSLEGGWPQPPSCIETCA